VRRTSFIIAVSIAVVAGLAQPALAAWKGTTISSNGGSPTTSLVVGPDGRTYVAWQSRGSDELYWARKTATSWRRTTVTGQSTFLACYEADLDSMGPSAAFLPGGDAVIASVCSGDGGYRAMFSRLTGSTWTTTRVGFTPTSSSCDTSATDADLVVSPGGKPVIFTTDQCLQGVYGFFRTPTGWKDHWVLKGGCCSPFRFGSMSLAVDPSTGKIAMAWVGDVFGRSSLFFEEFSWNGDPVAGSSHSFTLPNGDVPYDGPSLKIASDGTAYIAFREGTTPGTALGSAYSFLAMTTRTAGVWSTPASIDDSVQFTGGEPDLSLVGGTFHIAYYDNTNEDLRYARSPDGSTWTLGTIATAGDSGNYPSLGITATGDVRISYFHRSDNSLRAVAGP